MLNNIEFDLWADDYDKTVGISDEENTYPFAGYKKVLGFIFQTIMRTGNAVVLDIGFGTGTLTTKLYERGCSIYGQDFSARMIALASEKMPNAQLYQGDFSKGLVEPLRNFRYDYIVATYSLMQIILMKWNCALQRPCFYAHGNFNRVFYTFSTKWLLWNSSSPSSRILQSSTDSPLRSTAR